MWVFVAFVVVFLQTLCPLIVDVIHGAALELRYFLNFFKKRRYIGGGGPGFYTAIINKSQYMYMSHQLM